MNIKKIHRKLNKVVVIATVLMISISIMYCTIPMLVLQGDYIHTIHDGLDSFGGRAQYIHDKGTFLNPNEGVDFYLSDISKHYFGIAYEIYTVLCYGLGFLPGQIITRVFGVIIGSISLWLLLNYIYKNATVGQKCLMALSSVAYVITPISPSRVFAFATLPAVALLFLHLREKNSVSYISLLALLIPFFSMFTSTLVFVIGLWGGLTILCWIIEKKLNINHAMGLILMCISTIVLYRPMLVESLNTSATNRTLFNRLYHSDFKTTFKSYLLDGQYHSSALHGFVILPTLLLLTLWMIVYAFKFHNKLEEDYKKCACIIACGWGMWIASAFLLAARESGLETGITIIDGFSWGRLVGFMRPLWYVMMAAFYCLKPQRKMFENDIIGCINGLVCGAGVWFGVKILLGTNYTPVLIGQSCFSWIAKGVFFALSLLLFTSHHYRQLAIYVVLCVQLVYVSLSNTSYNDVGKTMIMKYINPESDASITFNEFYSVDLFSRIKEDIDYDDELVVAYGYHPAVLMYNGFETIDRYESVHSMRMQNQFREIIAPALDIYPNYEEYYDNWGGRMYLYGEVGFEPERNKDIGEHPLYINTDALKKYGGVYILSRVKISNAGDLGVLLVNDYDDENSIYHIFLYKVI